MNTLELLERIVEQATGKSVDYLRETPLCELRRNAQLEHPERTPFYNLNPLDIGDARKIITEYEKTKDAYITIPQKVIDAQLTIAID